jgi:hypothetical protein
MHWRRLRESKIFGKDADPGLKEVRGCELKDEGNE